MENQGMTLAQGMKLKRVIRSARDLKHDLECRLEKHMEGGECVGRYKNCHFEKDGYTKREYYELECKAGRKLYSRVERQSKRIAKLTALQGIFAKVEFIQIKGR